MKFQMAKNSLFAILLRSSWWVSAAIAIALGALGVALLPEQFRGAGALMGLPFAVVAVMALRRQWNVPGAARVAETGQALAGMAWPAFSALLEQAFRREGYSVERSDAAAVDFRLQRKGRETLVSARRWKSARTGLEPLRALQAAREKAESADALYIGLGELTASAKAYAAEHRIAIWDAAALAQALRGLRPGEPKAG